MAGGGKMNNGGAAADYLYSLGGGGPPLHHHSHLTFPFLLFYAAFSYTFTRTSSMAWLKTRLTCVHADCREEKSGVFRRDAAGRAVPEEGFRTVSLSGVKNGGGFVSWRTAMRSMVWRAFNGGCGGVNNGLYTKHLISGMSNGIWKSWLCNALKMGLQRR